MKQGLVYCLLFLLLVVFGVGLHGWQSKLSQPKLTPAEYIEQVHKDVPPPPAPLQVEPQKEKPRAAARVRPSHRPYTPRHLPQGRPLDRKAPVVEVPPQQGDNVPVRLGCLFPFNLIPACYVDAS